MGVLSCYEAILKVKKEYFSLQNSVFDFFKSSSGTRPSPPVLLDTEHDDPDELPAVQGKVCS
jgi:hypothetical protein